MVCSYALRATRVRNHEMRQIFDAFSSDLVALTKSANMPVVVIIDTFEKASESLQNWIARELVPRISSLESVVWIIAGQQTPPVKLRDANWLLQQQLRPLAAEYRWEYLRRIKLEWDEVLIKFICEASNGKPKELQGLAIVAVGRM